MATIDEYRKRTIQQNKALKSEIDVIAAQVGDNSKNIEYNAEAIEELATIIGGDSNG